jgi:hypothetical protein
MGHMYAMQGPCMPSGIFPATSSIGYMRAQTFA